LDRGIPEPSLTGLESRLHPVLMIGFRLEGGTPAGTAASQREERAMARQIGREWRRPAASRAVLALVVGWSGWIGAATLVAAQEPGPAAGRAVADIRDHAGVFGADAIASARGELERVARQTGASIIIETVDSLGGEPADRFAIDHARRSG